MSQKNLKHNMPTNSPIRILQYSQRCYTKGGIGKFIQNFYYYANKKFSFDFAILCSKNLNKCFKKKVIRKGNLFLTGNEKADSSLKYRLFFWYRLFCMMQTQKYDYFCSHETHPIFLVNFCLAKLAHIKKTALLAHSTLSRNPSVKERIRLKIFRSLAFFLIDERLAVSKEAGYAFYGKEGKFKIWHVGIETDRFKYNKRTRYEIRKKLGLNDALTFGFVGRISAEKNIKFLLDIFKNIHQKHFNVRLVIVGIKEVQISSILTTLNVLEISKKIIFIGDVENSAPYYQAFDAFILPSLYEGLPLVHLEAQAAGLPCFLSDTISTESAICNTMFLPLSVSAKQWADTIWAKVCNFQRKDCSYLVKKQGFDIKDSVQQLEKIFSK